LCIALTGLSGLVFGQVVGLVLFPLADFSSHPHEPSIHLVKPMMGLADVCAVIGACVGGFVAWRHFRSGEAGRLPNQPQEPASREASNRES
jgi:hypothetical protein